MRHLALPFCVAMLASPIVAFDICRELNCYEPSDSPAVSVTLDIPIKGRDDNPVVRVDLYESHQVCDPSKVEIFGQPLPVDENGRGKGALKIIPDVSITAEWEFSCATPKDASTEHKLRFTIDSIDGQEIQETTFETRFRQTWPIVFTSVEGSSLAEEPQFSRGTLHYGPEGGQRVVTYEEL